MRDADKNLGERNSKCVLLELKTVADLPHIDNCAKSGITITTTEGKNWNENEMKLNAQDFRTEIEGCVECLEVDGDAKPNPCRVIIAPPCMPTESGAAELRTSATATWLADAVLGFAKP